MDTRFLYSVNPKKPIRTIKGVPVLRTPKSLQLTKEDVRECLKYGSVYRRFANESRIERVTINNVDRLHNAKFMTEKEYEAFLQDNIDNKVGTVINTTVFEESVVEEVPVIEDEVVGEEFSEDSVEEHDKGNTVTETVENPTSALDGVEVPKYYENNKNYGGKKHRR
jgi:hypothetical protein